MYEGEVRCLCHGALRGQHGKIVQLVPALKYMNLGDIRVVGEDVGVWLPSLSDGLASSLRVKRWQVKAEGGNMETGRLDCGD